MRPERGTIDRSIGRGNGVFLAHVANRMPRPEIERRFKAGEYEDLHKGLATYAMAQAGMGRIK
ncbi:hypothetical protein [Novosphingobium sp. M1R2S20]|uniref:Uncharacterized protein n=1 Tax=Novosphingobium rhizovicinum TaxID=3228928 RepID=A0ABV3RCY1_9SPHN